MVHCRPGTACRRRTRTRALLCGASATACWGGSRRPTVHHRRLYSVGSSWLDRSNGQPLQRLRVGDLIFGDDLPHGRVRARGSNGAVVVSRAAPNAGHAPFLQGLGHGPESVAPDTGVKTLDFSDRHRFSCHMAKHISGPPMTLANMRANRVRRLAVSCWQCHHEGVINVDRYGDDVPVPSFGPRMVCTKCGTIGCDARPNWVDLGFSKSARP